MGNELQRYVVTGNANPMRLGRVFPTGWTRLRREDGVVEVAASTRWPNSKLGTDVKHVGTINLSEVVKRQVA